MRSDSPSRRAVLIAGAGTAATAALAACTSSAAPKKVPGGHTLAKLAEVPVGSAVSVRLPDGSPAIVSRPSATTAAAFHAACTHQGCPVRPAGTKLDCPCHGSQFAAATGKVLHGPATRPLAGIPVRVSGGNVVTTTA